MPETATGDDVTIADIQKPFTFVIPVQFDRVEELSAALNAIPREHLNGALDKVGTVHSSRFVLLEDKEQRWAKLLIVAIFDGTMEDYLWAFNRELKREFATLLSFAEDTEDKPKLPLEDNFEDLVKYVEARDVEPVTGRSYGAYPGWTALDIAAKLNPEYRPRP